MMFLRKWAPLWALNWRHQIDWNEWGARGGARDKFRPHSDEGAAAVDGVCVWLLIRADNRGPLALGCALVRGLAGRPAGVDWAAMRLSSGSGRGKFVG